MGDERDTGSTPEKQLLKLIEQPEGAVQTQETVRRKGLEVFSVSAMRGRVSFLKEKLKLAFAARRGESSLKRVNTILVFCALCLVVFLLIGVGFSAFALSSIEIPAGTASPVEIPEIKQRLKDRIEYTERFRIRSTFDFSPDIMSEMEVKIGVVEKPPGIEDLIKGLVKMGITMPTEEGDVLECMIWDGEKTHFLKLDGEVRGMKVVEITKERVVLRYKGEERELK